MAAVAEVGEGYVHDGSIEAANHRAMTGAWSTPAHTLTSTLMCSALVHPRRSSPWQRSGHPVHCWPRLIARWGPALCNHAPPRSHRWRRRYDLMLESIWEDPVYADNIAHQLNKWAALVQFLLYNLAVVVIFGVNAARANGALAS